MNHIKKASGQFFKAHGNSTIIFDFHIKALYDMYPQCWTSSIGGILVRYSYEYKKKVLSCIDKENGQKRRKA